MSDEIEVVEVQDQEVPDHISPEAEQEARQFGWVPKEEFHGDPNDWRDADEFLKRGREINGFLRKDLEKLKNQLSQRDSEIQELKAVAQEFKKFHEETEERAYKRALDELRAQRKEAMQEGDFERLDEVEAQLDALKESKKKEPTTTVDKQNTPPTLDPIFIAWSQENEWIKDPELEELATGIAAGLRAKGDSSTGRDFLDKVKDKVMKYAPDKFGKNVRTQHSMVDVSSSDRRVDTKKKTYADLPDDAKKACDRYVKAGLLTKDQYVKDYFG